MRWWPFKTLRWKKKRKSGDSGVGFRMSWKHVTVLFSDIEDSTRYWDAHGDVRGRLMVDQHNRLLFPVIKKYRGKVIKTIGDAIMATFPKPGYAVKAAIAMQQLLERERQDYKRHILKVRIGIHTGEAIIEQKDVFGDMVNVAARVESFGKGNEILVSNTTAARCRRKEYCLSKKGQVVFKGKDRAMTLYRCNWRKSPSLIDDVQYNPYLPLFRQHQIELMIHVFATLFVLFFLYYKYLRYYLADAEEMSLWFFQTFNFLNKWPIMAALIVALVIIIYVVISKFISLPRTVLRIFYSGYHFCFVFLICYLVFTYIPVKVKSKWSESLYTSIHSFVELQGNTVNIRQKPSLDAPVLKKAASGDIFLLTDALKDGQMAWIKILIRKGTYGWVLRNVPPKMGVPSRSLASPYQFHFRFRDLYAIALGFLGFWWGFFRFRIRPV